jgi:hypothetical protein
MVECGCDFSSSLCGMSARRTLYKKIEVNNISVRSDSHIHVDS